MRNGIAAVFLKTAAKIVTSKGMDVGDEWLKNRKAGIGASKGGKTSIPDKAKQIANDVKNNNGTPP